MALHAYVGPGSYRPPPPSSPSSSFQHPSFSFFIISSLPSRLLSRRADFSLGALRTPASFPLLPAAVCSRRAPLLSLFLLALSLFVDVPLSLSPHRPPLGHKASDPRSSQEYNNNNDNKNETRGTIPVTLHSSCLNLPDHPGFRAPYGTHAERR